MNDLEYELKELIGKYGLKEILSTLSFFCEENCGKEPSHEN